MSNNPILTGSIKYGKPVYYDKKGWEIRNGDVIKVHHFKSRNRTYYMYKIVWFKLDWGWVALHTGSSFDPDKKSSYNLHVSTDERGYLCDVEIMKECGIGTESRIGGVNRKRIKPKQNER